MIQNELERERLKKEKKKKENLWSVFSRVSVEGIITGSLSLSREGWTQWTHVYLLEYDLAWI